MASKKIQTLLPPADTRRNPNQKYKLILKETTFAELSDRILSKGFMFDCFTTSMFFLKKKKLL